jgi:perosamine synthetase
MTESPLRVPWSGKGHTYTPEEIELVARVMRDADSLTQNKYQAEFEATFRETFKANHAFAVATGTAALELAALLCDLKAGDEVILPAHTFAATAIPFARTGAKLVWADIDPDTLVATAETIEPLITKQTKVIVVVHLYGLVADLDPIMDLAKKHQLRVVEDAAQVIGARYKDQYAGTIGDFGCYSFHSHKNMTTLGEGGMFVVKDPTLAKLVPGLRHNGVRAFPPGRDRYWVPAMSNVDFDIEGLWPYNFCIGEVQCALGTALLKRLPQMNSDRKRRAASIVSTLRDVPELQFQSVKENCEHIYHLLVARYVSPTNRVSRDDLIELLFREFRVQSVVQYYPLYRYPMFMKAGFGKAQCPETDRFFDNMISFPFQHWLTEDQLEYLTSSIRKACEILRTK